MYLSCFLSGIGRSEVGAHVRTVQELKLKHFCLIYLNEDEDHDYKTTIRRFSPQETLFPKMERTVEGIADLILIKN